MSSSLSIDCVKAKSGHAPEPMIDAREITVVDLSGATLISTVCHKIWSCSMYLNARGKSVMLSQVHNMCSMLSNIQQSDAFKHVYSLPSVSRA